MKQELTEALARLESEIELHRDDEYNPGFVAWLEDQSFICAAAALVERLLPGVCPNHSTKGKVDLTEKGAGVVWGPCPICHSDSAAGQVWDEGIVEAVSREFAMALGAYRSELTARAFVELCNAHARSVLSALVELLTEKVET